MGNCCCVLHGSGSVAVWAEDDWPNAQESTERQELLGEVGVSSSSKVGTTGNQVRIRITRRELEEMLHYVDYSDTQLNKMKAHQVLQKLMDKSEHFEGHNHRSWTPALQSIPEVN